MTSLSLLVILAWPSAVFHPSGPETQVDPPASEVTQEPAATGEEAHVLAPEDRTYTFRMVDVPCSEILEEFARRSGLELIETLPECRASFDCGQEAMSFDLALNRLRLLLLRTADCDLVRKGNALEIVRAPVAGRFLANQPLLDVNLFKKLELGDERIAWVVYRALGHLSDEQVTMQKYMPAHVSVRRVEDRDMLLFLSVAKDLRRYLALAEMLGGDDAKPSAVERFQLENVQPDAAVRELRRILGRVAVYKSILPNGPSRDGGDSPQAEEPPNSPAIRVWIDEPHQSLIVRCPRESMKDVSDALQRLDARRPPASDGQ
jgi:hypothetical protein